MEPYHKGYEDGYWDTGYENFHEMGTAAWESYDNGYADGVDTREEERNEDLDSYG